MDRIIFASDVGPSETECFLEAAGIPFIRCEGRYQGLDEVAWLVMAAAAPRISTLVQKQESVLWITKGGMAHLRYVQKHSPPVCIGTFTPVSEEIAQKEEAFTFFPDDQQYYICR